MKILIVLPSYDNGGAENYALRLIKYAGCETFHWHVTSSQSNKDSMKTAFKEAGAITHYASPGIASLSKMVSFFRFLKRERFDVVMTFTGVFGGLPIALGRMAGIKRRIGWHRRSTPAHSPTLLNNTYAAICLKLLNVFSTKILSNSASALDHFHTLNWRANDLFQVIPNGVDGHRFKPMLDARWEVRRAIGLQDNDFVIGHVGRFDPAKDHRTLLAIVRKLKEKGRPVKLVVVGSGTESREFGALVESFGLCDTSYCLGVRGDIESIYSAMDIFLFTSVTEGQPNALIEAMLSGVEIVATSITPIRDTVPAELHCRLFTPGDVEMASALIEEVGFEVPISRLRYNPRDWALKTYEVNEKLSYAMSFITR